MEEKKVPALRFRGFDNAWEQRRVGEFLSISKVPGHTGLNAKKLTVKLWGKGIIEKTDKLSGSENTRYYVRYAGQFMYGKLDFLHAAFGIVPDDLDNYESTLDSPAFDLHNIDGKFLLERVTQKDFYLRNGMTANGSRKAKRVHEDVFLNMDLVVTSYQEQEIIGKFFNKFDHLISLHQRKLEMLKKVKKSMLEKMFPKNDAKVPEVRFSDFTDAWEQCKVSEIFKIARGYVLAATETADIKDDKNCYPVYSSQTKNEGLMGFYSEYLYENTITWTTDGANAGTVRYRSGKFYCTNVCGILLSEEGYANKAVSEALNSVAWKYVSYVGNPKLMNNVMADIEIVIPKSVKEQETISRYFDEIDDLIILHQRKLEKLKNIKKSMLEKMFII